MTEADLPRRIKQWVFWTAKKLGLFHLSALLTKNQLRILCYHGFSALDEHHFRPKLFMSPRKFQDRMEWLSRSGIDVIPLERATRLLREGENVSGVVITFDDGFHGTYCHALPVLRRHGMPATIYVTSYYVQARVPVFNVLVAYLFWKTAAPTLELSEVDWRLSGQFDLRREDSCREAMERVLAFGDGHLSALQRVDLSERLAQALDVEWEPLVRFQACALMTPEEVKESIYAGVDIQLHTHRHRFDLEDDADVRKEIQDNERALAVMGATQLTHFCYPSGFWTSRSFRVLREMGVVSAVTCDRGLNSPSTPPLALRRFLDGEDVSQLEFEAYLYGFYHFFDLARRHLSLGVARRSKLSG